MFIPIINTGGREAPFSIPLGLEAKSLKNGMTHYWISRALENKQTKLIFGVEKITYLTLEYGVWFRNFERKNFYLGGISMVS